MLFGSSNSVTDEKQIWDRRSRVRVLRCDRSDLFFRCLACDVVNRNRAGSVWFSPIVPCIVDGGVGLVNYFGSVEEMA